MACSPRKFLYSMLDSDLVLGGGGGGGGGTQAGGGKSQCAPPPLCMQHCTVLRGSYKPVARLPSSYMPFAWTYFLQASVCPLVCMCRESCYTCLVAKHGL